jgi:hypothetical protein
MSIKRIAVPAVLGLCLVLAVVAGPTTADAVPPPSSLPSLPQVVSAQEGAGWLAGQLTASGYIPSPTVPGQADLAATANTVLALSSAGVDPTGAQAALSYLEAHVDAYVSVNGSDGPGQLALLILGAHALGVDPRSFGGTDLVARLLATERTTGANAGLFGVQPPAYDGAYRQGLSLAALAAAGVTGTSQVSSAEAWLRHQQCPDGGWTSYIKANNPCNGDPANFEGPDTNSTSLAVQGLSAQGGLSTTRANEALSFLEGAQDGDGGWGYEPNAADAPGSTDPDSTALVIQAIEALGTSPSSTVFVKGGANPVSALLGFQITSGTGSGAFAYPGVTGPNTLATYQAVPAVAGVVFPFNLHITTPSLANGSVGVQYSATVGASGGNPPYTWKLLAGSGVLPPGLSLGKATGTISGKPTTAGTYQFVIEVRDSAATPLDTRNISWKVFTIVT